MINNVLQRKGETDSKGKIMSITYKTMSNILKKHHGRPKKIRKVFYTAKKDKEKKGKTILVKRSITMKYYSLMRVK